MTEPDPQLRASDDSDGRALRASDGDRNGVVEILTAAATDGRLDMEEYSERSATAYAARTMGELQALTADLVRPGAAPSEPAVPAAAVMSAVLGNESRKGRWIVPQHLLVKSVLGDCHLELQQAVLQHQVTTIDATAILGSVTIFVPEGIDVQLNGRARLGAKSLQLRGSARPGAPIIIVNATAILGSVTVRPPKWLMR